MQKGEVNKKTLNERIKQIPTKTRELARLVTGFGLTAITAINFNTNIQTEKLRGLENNLKTEISNLENSSISIRKDIDLENQSNLDIKEILRSIENLQSQMTILKEQLLTVEQKKKINEKYQELNQMLTFLMVLGAGATGTLNALEQEEIQKRLKLNTEFVNSMRTIPELEQYNKEADINKYLVVIKTNKYYESWMINDCDKALIEINNKINLIEIKYDKTGDYKMKQELEQLKNDLINYFSLDNKNKKTFGLDTSNISIIDSDVSSKYTGFSQLLFDKELNKIEKKLLDNLNLVNFESGRFSISVNREVYKKLRKLSSKDLQELLQATITKSEIIDPRTNQAITGVPKKAEKVLGSNMVIKDFSRRNDRNTPESQYIASRVMSIEINRIGLDDILEIGRIYGFYTNRITAESYSLIEKVEGITLLELMNNPEDIPENIKIKILSSLQSQLLNLLEMIKVKEEDNNEIDQDITKDDYTDSNLLYLKEIVTNQKEHIVNLLDNIRNILNDRKLRDSKNIYLLFSYVLNLILSNRSVLNYTFWSEMTHSIHYDPENTDFSTGSMNLMYDRVKQKLIAIDPGPEAGLNI